MDLQSIEINFLDIEDLEKKIILYKYFYFGNSVKYYEKIVKKLGNIFKLSASKKEIEEFNKINSELLLFLDISEILSASAFVLMISIIIGLVLSLAFQNAVLFLFVFLFGILGFIYIRYYYIFLYNKLRAKKKSQLLLLLLYLVIKLRQNPNLEKALIYSTKFINLPIKLDLLRLLRDVYHKKYVSVYEALDDYSKSWEKDAYFFTLGVMLIFAALVEVDETKRNFYFDKAIEDVLEELINELSVFIREERSTINIVSMLGIILPILLLTIFPLASIFLSDMFPSYSLFVIFNILIPFLIYFLIQYNVASKMLDVFSKDDLYLYIYMKKRDISSKIKMFVVSSLLFIFLISLIFVILSKIFVDNRVPLMLISELLVLVIGLSIIVGASIYYNNYKDLIDTLTGIDNEIPAFLVSLGNALNIGYPLEKAIIYVYPKFQNKNIGSFIRKVYANLRAGMDLNKAIFDKREGAILYYPSSNLEAAMEIITESSNVSPKESSKMAFVVSRYLLYMNKLKARFLDLIAEDISQLKSLVNLLAPLLLGIITGVTVMILEILYRLSFQLRYLAEMTKSSGEISEYISGLPETILNIFGISSIPSAPQIIFVIGLFNTTITILIIYLLNILENGGDKLKFYQYLYSKGIKGILLFFIVSSLSSLAAYFFVDSILQLSNLIP